jgi:hypothetical protein
MVRLGLQGVELLEHGRVTLPVPEPHLTWLRDLRQGRHTMEDALEFAKSLEGELRDLRNTSSLPEKPDYKRANRWLIGVYLHHWADTL